MGELEGTSVRVRERERENVLESGREIKRDWAGFSVQVKRFSSLGVFTQMRREKKENGRSL